MFLLRLQNYDGIIRLIILILYIYIAVKHTNYDVIRFYLLFYFIPNEYSKVLINWFLRYRVVLSLKIYNISSETFELKRKKNFSKGLHKCIIATKPFRRNKKKKKKRNKSGYRQVNDISSGAIHFRTFNFPPPDCMCVKKKKMKRMITKMNDLVFRRKLEIRMLSKSFILTSTRL